MRLAFALVLASAAATACVSYALPPDDTAATTDAGTPVTVTTLAAPSSSSPGGKMSAAWAAFQIDDGPWQALSPKSEGVYVFPVDGARWALALACDDPRFESSTIAVERHPAVVTATAITLPDPCRLQPPNSFLVTGTLSNIPSATSWFEFGYPLEARGSVLPVQGTAATYELANVVDGTWDVAFAVRDTPAGPLTRTAILRGRKIDADLSLDVDLGGATSFVPKTRPMTIHAAVADENVTAYVWYSTGGPAGLSVGPQDVPLSRPDVLTSYSTIPESVVAATDRYVFEATSQISHEDPGARVVTGSFHAQMDLEITLPDALPSPTAKMPTATSVETTYAKQAGFESYVVDVSAQVTRRSVRRFVTTVDARIATGIETTPDLTSLAGFRPEWSLPDAQTVSVVTGIEPETTLGDGKLRRRTTSYVVVRP